MSQAKQFYHRWLVTDNNGKMFCSPKDFKGWMWWPKGVLCLYCTHAIMLEINALESRDPYFITVFYDNHTYGLAGISMSLSTPPRPVTYESADSISVVSGSSSMTRAVCPDTALLKLFDKWLSTVAGNQLMPDKRNRMNCVYACREDLVKRWPGTQTFYHMPADPVRCSTRAYKEIQLKGWINKRDVLI